MGIWQSVCFGVRQEGRREAHHSCLHSSHVPYTPPLPPLPSSPQAVWSSQLWVPTALGLLWPCTPISMDMPLLFSSQRTEVFDLPSDQHGSGAQEATEDGAQGGRAGVGFARRDSLAKEGGSPSRGCRGSPGAAARRLQPLTREADPAAGMFVLANCLTEQTRCPKSRRAGTRIWRPGAWGTDPTTTSGEGSQSLCSQRYGGGGEAEMTVK